MPAVHEVCAGVYAIYLWGTRLIDWAIYESNHYPSTPNNEGASYNHVNTIQLYRTADTVAGCDDQQR